VLRVFVAARAVLLNFEALWIIAPVLHGCVIPLLALGASEMNNHPYILLLSHNSPLYQVKGPELAAPRTF
jgi:hypothetical protein